MSICMSFSVGEPQPFAAKCCTFGSVTLVMLVLPNVATAVPNIACGLLVHVTSPCLLAFLCV